jgi:hypothetical protein
MKDESDAQSTPHPQPLSLKGRGENERGGRADILLVGVGGATPKNCAISIARETLNRPRSFWHAAKHRAGRIPAGTA